MRLAGEAWATGRPRQGTACAAVCVHIRAASALRCDAPERRVCESFPTAGFECVASSSVA